LAHRSAIERGEHHLRGRLDVELGCLLAKGADGRARNAE
jgi:hypothetical protein